MRAPISLAALALLAGCQLNSVRHTKVYKPAPAVDATAASEAVQIWRETLGLKRFASVEATPAPPSSLLPTDEKGDWIISATDDKGLKWIATVSKRTGRVTQAFKNPLTMMTSGGSKRRYTRGEDAMKDIAKAIEPLTAGREITLTSFDIGPDLMPGSGMFIAFGRSMYGGMSAHYSVLAHGKPFFGGMFGIDIELDPATGEITRYSEILNTPPTGSPIPLVLPIAALATAEKAVGVKPGTFASTPAILGWAVPTGGTEARLFYFIDGSSGSVSYTPTFVSAETGRVDPGIAKTLAAAPGVGRVMGGSIIYRVRASGGGMSVYSSSGFAPAIPAKKPPAKAAPKKKP